MIKSLTIPSLRATFKRRGIEVTDIKSKTTFSFGRTDYMVRIDRRNKKHHGKIRKIVKYLNSMKNIKKAELVIPIGGYEKVGNVSLTGPFWHITILKEKL